MLANMEIIEDSNRTYFIFSEQKFNSIFSNHESKREVFINNKEVIKHAISFLYSQEVLNGGMKKEKFTPLARPLVRRQNHYYYFNYQLFGAIPMKDFRESSESSVEKLIMLIDRHQDKLNDYLEIVTKAKQLPFDNALKNGITSILYCYKYTNDLYKLSDIIMSFISTQYDLLKNETDRLNEFIEFIENELLTNSLKDYFNNSKKNTHVVRSEVTLSLLKFYFRNRDENESKTYILSMETLIQTNKRIFYDYIENKNHEEDVVYSLVSNNWARIEISTNKVVLNNEVCLEYSKYLKTNYRWYVKNLIRPYIIPETISYEYTFDPFIPQIFGGYSDFESFLNSLPENDCVDYNKKKYSEFRDNGYKPIIIKDFRTESPCLNND